MNDALWIVLPLMGLLLIAVWVLGLMCLARLDTIAERLEQIHKRIKP